MTPVMLERIFGGVTTTGKPSSRRRKPYSRESIGRALSHHERTGAVLFVSPPGGSQSKWRVRLAGQVDSFDTLEFTDAQAYVLCLGLRASEAARTGAR